MLQLVRVVMQEAEMSEAPDLACNVADWSATCPMSAFVLSYMLIIEHK
jgi:hypothetical protein